MNWQGCGNNAPSWPHRCRSKLLVMRHWLSSLITSSWKCSWVLVMAWLLCPAAAGAQDHILEKSYWTDTTATASFDEARAANYTPYSGVLSKGFSRDVQWIRLRIGGVPADGPDSLVLRIRPVFLDEITLYDPVALAKGQSTRSAGDITPLANAEFESLNHAFVIPAQSTPREVWLRLSTVSTQLLHVEALTPRDMLRQEHSLWLIYSALLALILSFLVWVFLAWLRDRDPVNGMFVLRQTVLLLYTASYLGYHRLLLSDWISPQGQNLAYGWLVLLTTGLSFAFESKFLREYNLPRWAQWLLRCTMVTSGVAMTLLLLGQTQWALQLNMVLNAWGILTMLVVSSCIRQPLQPQVETDTYHLPKPFVVSYYASVVVVLAMSVLPSLGVLQGTMLSIYGVLLYGLLSGLFMTGLLLVRARQIERLRIEVANSLYLSRKQLAIEQKRREDQTQLLSMLMHELKTPLAVIDMAVSTRTHDGRTADFVGRAVSNIQGILERCIQTDRMVEREFKLQSQTLNLSIQLQQWLHDRHEGAERICASIMPELLLRNDLQCIQIIVNNLIDNALKHGDLQLPVQIDLSAHSSDSGHPGVRLTVSNAPGASGWPDGDKVFAKYYRSSNAQRLSGTGLGLYLSHKLAAQLGGALRYLPDDRSIRFELWLPT